MQNIKIFIKIILIHKAGIILLQEDENKKIYYNEEYKDTVAAD